MSNDTVTEVEMKESETGGRQSWDDPGSKEEEVGVNGSWKKDGAWSEQKQGLRLVLPLPTEPSVLASLEVMFQGH